jgi:hypothetical protein
MSSEAPGRNPREADRLIYVGLLGLGAAAVIQLIDKDVSEFDLAQSIGLYGFAISIPLLAAALVADYARQASIRVSGIYDLVGFLGSACAVGGFGSMFFHFGIGQGLTFVACAFLAFVLIRRLD